MVLQKKVSKGEKNEGSESKTEHDANQSTNDPTRHLLSFVDHRPQRFPIRQRLNFPDPPELVRNEANKERRVERRVSQIDLSSPRLFPLLPSKRT